MYIPPIFTKFLNSPSIFGKISKFPPIFVKFLFLLDLLVFLPPILTMHHALHVGYWVPLLVHKGGQYSLAPTYMQTM